MNVFATLLLTTLVAAEQPNIVLILADDLGSGDVSCYNPDSRIPTPHIDRLAQEGVRFTDAHSPSAVCTPTRYGILTGRYAWRSRLKSGVLWNGYARPLIEPDRMTIASLLQAHGYTTGCVGKWHLGFDWSSTTEQPVTASEHAHVDFSGPITNGPDAVGFDEYSIIPASLDMEPYCWIDDGRVRSLPMVDDPGSKRVWSGGNGFWRAGKRSHNFEFDHVLDDTVARSLRFIDDHADDETPFFLYIPLTAPHTPWVPNDRFDGTTEIGAYGDFVHEVDSVVGRIVKAIDEHDLRDDTIVIVTSDNGAHWPSAQIEKHTHRANASWRGQKADIHEGGHRVPFILRWPGRVEAGSTSDATIVHTDLFASLAHIAGVDVPAGAAEDSAPVIPYTDGAHDFRAVIHHSLDGMFAVRHRDWKLIEGLGSGGFTEPKRQEPDDDGPTGQLYHLKSDPGETNNRFAELPEVVAHLSDMLESTRARRSDRPNVLIFLTDDQTYNAVHALGDAALKTPNMDGLVARGTSFTNAYIAGGQHGAVCMPSRAMLLTGQHYFALPRSITQTWSVPGEQRGQYDGVTAPEIFRAAGYDTFFTGKWHNGRSLLARGFTHAGNIFFGGMCDHDRVPVHQFDPTGRYDARSTIADGLSSDLFSSAAVEFLRDRDSDAPFMMLVSYTAPHDPRTPPPAFAGIYDPATTELPPNFSPTTPVRVGVLGIRDEKLGPYPREPDDVRAHIAAYRGMISHLDATIGTVLRQLALSDELQDTYIVLTSDNGLAVGQHGLLGKQNIYEHSARIPLVIAGPDIPHDERHSFVYLHDLFPTLLDLCDLQPLPDVHGESFVKALRGEDAGRPHLLLTYGEANNEGTLAAVFRGVRLTRWKLICTAVHGVTSTELYDLQDDPWETNNLADDPRFARRRDLLQHRLRALMQHLGDPVVWPEDRAPAPEAGTIP